MRLLALGLLLGCTVGCGSDAPFEMAQVQGKVTYEDGSLIDAPRVVVEFHPQAEPLDPKTYPKPASAEVNTADGTFSEASTWTYADGVVAGPQKVTVTSYDEMEAITDHVPAEYRNPDTTPIEVVVDSSNQQFEFKIPKP
jgi:hypothetical protein